ncbi:tyrosine-type recombinase/integrase [Bradyrhizobium elkanii]|uniref:tyrosine-type recombinase/integrase n=1 Tax=Bradyrhizobium elkanii TaxID=29448 RepID=UPI0027152E56|nr:tyrosine-type recombinase/integrase [Bradyrhizobium elkanii]WLA99883.1 tyrosine-type recombinase/integrase [Bradyrhizobium elkanii]
MASYLWLRGAHWFFQLRPPRDLQSALGSTPIRIRLLCQTRREASRFARHLAGASERWFLSMRYRGFERLRIFALRNNIENSERHETPDQIKSLQAALRRKFTDALQAEVDALRQIAVEYDGVSSQEERGNSANRRAVQQKKNEIALRGFAGWQEFAQKTLADYEQLFRDLQSELEAKHRILDDLQALTENYGDDFQEWKQKLTNISQKANEFEAQARSAHEANTKAMGKVEEVTHRLLYQGPKLSECLQEFLDAKTVQLPKNSREPEYFKHRLKAFLEIVGDQPIAAYTEADLTRFAGRLQHLPERHTVDPAWKGMTLVQAIEENENRSRSNRVETISFTTVKIGYIGKVKTAIRWLCANHHVGYPFKYAHTLIPKDLPTPTIRFGLDTDQLNKLFAHCAADADERRPEDVWLPLLAFLTGARLGELVSIQPHNIRQRHGVYVVDLTGRIMDSDGIRNRPLKTRESLRLFALHDSLTKLGFIDWVQQQKRAGHEYVFPDLHSAARPTHAASKRFQRVFRGLKMGGPHVFHSLRHSFKDWARQFGVEERTITLQAGHSLDGIALRYGNRYLREDELKKIASLPFPAGLDVSPYQGANPRPLVQPPVRRPVVDLINSDKGSVGAQQQPRPAHRKERPVPDTHDAIDVAGLRKALGLSQREFARTFDISIGNVRDWEQGRSRPGRLARTLLRSIQLGQEQVLGQTNTSSAQ